MISDMLKQNTTLTWLYLNGEEGKKPVLKIKEEYINENESTLEKGMILGNLEQQCLLRHFKTIQH